MSNLKKIIMLVLTAIMLTSLIGCSKKEPEITGKWVSEDNNEYFDLFSDGSGVFGNTNPESEDYLKTLPLTWIAEEGRLKINVDFGIMGSSSVSFAYTLTETTLTLTYDDETVKTYTKEE